MKKRTLFIFVLMLTAIIVTSCGKNKPYSLDAGAYGFEKVTITNLTTKEITEKLFDDIINDNTEYLHWGWLFSFTIGIDKDTEFIYTSDNRCFTMNNPAASREVSPSGCL